MTETPNGLRRRILSIIVQNEPGVLARVVDLFSGRGWNIDGLTVAAAFSAEFKDKDIARITIVTTVDNAHLSHVVAKIDNIVPVLAVKDITDDPDKVETDITLVKALTDNPELQTKISVMAQAQFRGMAIRTRATFVTLRFVGQQSAAADFVAAIRHFGVDVETAHSGPVAIA